MKERLDNVLAAMKNKNSPEQDNHAQLRAWSGVWVAQGKIAVAEAQLVDTPETMNALRMLRGVSIGALVSGFVNGELGVQEGSGRAKAKDLLPLCEQLRGVLPPECGPVMDEFKAYDKCMITAERLSREEVVTIVELAATVADARNILSKVKHQSMETKNAIASLETAWSKECAAWVEKQKHFRQFEELHDKFAQVLIAGCSGDFSKMPWLKQGNDPQVEADMEAYSDCRDDAQEVRRVSVSLGAIMKSCGGKEEANFTEIAQAAKKVTELEKSIDTIIPTIGLGSLLMGVPRPAKFEETLKKHASDYARGFKFDASRDLPTYLLQLYKEACDAPAAASRPVAVAQPQTKERKAGGDGVADGAVAPPAKKPKLLAAVQKLKLQKPA